MIPRLRILALVATVALVAAACAQTEPDPVAISGDVQEGNPSSAGAEEAPDISGVAPDSQDLAAPQSAQLDAVLAGSPGGCDFLDDSSCMLPFPSDALTTPDDTTGTGRIVAIPEGQLANTSGTTLDPTVWNLQDGFSPSTPIVVYIPDVDGEKTGFASVTEIQDSIGSDSPTVLVDLDSGQLIPHWAELDERAENADERSLIIHPAVSLKETHRIGVALQNIKDSDGNEIEPPIQFQALRDNLISGNEDFEARRGAFEVVFSEMAAAGLNRSELYLGWWFTVASSGAIAGDVLDMRDDAFGQLGGSSPAFTVDEVSSDDLEDGIAKVVSGTFDVPLYLSSDEPGATIERDSTGTPESNGTITAPYVCVVPEEALESGEARPVVYGHGSLGSASEASSSQVQVTAASGNFIYCGTDTIGMSEEDLGFMVEVLGDLSLFPAVSDRLQQAILNNLFLGRLMIHFEGLGSSEEFTTNDGATAFDTAEAYYDGNSQGAIMGGAITAVAQDWTKAVLGVGGMSYSTLLNRSVGFDEYLAVMRAAYPDPIEQQILFGVMQMLWDSGETAGYVQHLTNRTYRLTPPKQVLMTVAFGDHGVANVTADNIARTLKIPLYEPTLPEGADDTDTRFFGLEPIRSFPHTGSALYYWYSGTLPPPNGNITPIMGPMYTEECSGAQAEDNVKCEDPHEDPRRQPEIMKQKDAFFQPDGSIINVCEDEPCEALPSDEFDY